MTLQPKPYDQARREAFADHINHVGGRSEYIKVDFDAGFSAGYNAAMNNVAARKREDALRERAAIAAMQGMLARADLPLREVADVSVSYADALINQLNTEQS